MTTFPDINTKIWASIVKPGMIIRMPDNTRIEVEQITEGYSTWTFDNGCGRKASCDYGDRVELLGYFNPDKP